MDGRVTENDQKMFNHTSQVQIYLEESQKLKASASIMQSQIDGFQDDMD